MKQQQFLFLFILFQAIAAFGQDGDIEQSGFINAHPADHLPSYIKLACGFGERPDWSHDGEFILFVDKPMGEVYELELATGIIRPKTRHFNHYGFTRAMYLANGDILLSGPNAPFDPTDVEERDRARDLCWLSVMDKNCTKDPVPLNTLCAEGPAVSRTRMRIAWTHRDRQLPELGKNRAKLLMAEIIYEEGIPRLKNERVIFDSKQLPFSLGNSSLETQNLVPPDDVKVTFAVYTIENGNNTDVYMVDSESGDYMAITDSPCCYDEPEGIFPDGLYTCVEHAPSDQSAWPLIDLYKLKLDGSGEMQRLTNFTNYKGYKANQGVVSDDGKYLCFQIGKANQEAGVGFGFFIMDLEEAAHYLEDFKTYKIQVRKCEPT
ncbi:MAG: TolB family protein [Bacteroidales bacterium]